jgi:hypothetical protein
MTLRHPWKPFFPAIAAIALTCGCSDGGGGDEPSQPVKSVLGKGQRVSEVLGPADWLNPKDVNSVSCNVPADRTVLLGGLTVMAHDQFDETAKGALGNLYVQDTTKDPGEYQGLTVFGAAYTPPDLRVARGDVLDFFGVLSEFIGPSVGAFGGCKTLPEMSGTGTFRFEGSPTPAKVIKLQDILGYANARRYLGMLVTLENVTIASDPAASDDTLPTGGRYTAEIDRTGADTTGVDPADYPKISNELYDLKNQGPKLAKGTKLKSVTGIVTYFYGFKVAPRAPDDFVP